MARTPDRDPDLVWAIALLVLGAALSWGFVIASVRVEAGVVTFETGTPMTLGIILHGAALLPAFQAWWRRRDSLAALDVLVVTVSSMTAVCWVYMWF